MSKERDEIKELPERYKPMGAWGYWAWTIIYGFPLVGFIFVIINSIRGSNVARRNHARSYLCTFLIVTLILGITILIFCLTGVFDAILATIDGWMKSLNDMIQGT